MVDGRTRDVIGVDARDAPAWLRSTGTTSAMKIPRPPSLTAIADALPVDFLAERLR